MEELFSGLGRQGSSEGGRQGMPEMPPAFCIAIHPEARALDAELAQAGGCARFIMDDGYACGPPRVVFPALERFICRLQIATNLVAQRTKFAAHSPTFDLVDYAPLLTLGGMVSTFTGPIAPGGPPLRGHGLLVGGVPIGDAVYVQQHLHIVTTRIESYSQHTAIQLQDASHDAWALHHYCILPDFDHWLRHIEPLYTAPYAERIDAAALTFVGGIMQQPDLDHIRALLLRRLRQPARMHGGGQRSRVHLSPAAYSACCVESVEAMVGAHGTVAFFPMLAPLFGGAASFDDGGLRLTSWLPSPVCGLALLWHKSLKA